MADHDVNDKRNAVPFTARLIAYYRAIESKREDALIVDPFAEQLAGDMDPYFREHGYTRGTSDYAVVRTHYIDNYVLTPWSEGHEKSQVVLLGAGLDARAYRFEPFKKGDHTVFEIDYALINSYKESILKDSIPLCNLVRVSADLSEPTWLSKLVTVGFSPDIPTLWLLEGLVYYIDREIVISVLQTAAQNCADESQVFVDVCVPGLAVAQFGPFMMYFKWGLEKVDVPPFFAHSGWKVTCAYADDFDQGRDVGQKGLIFVTGKKDISKLGGSFVFSTGTEPMKIPKAYLKSVSQDFMMGITPEIRGIVKTYNRNPDEGLTLYLDFIRRIQPMVRRITMSLDDTLSVGRISSRLLRDPSTAVFRSREEEEAHIVGYLTAILLLAYCVITGIDGWQLESTPLYQESMKIRGDINNLLSFLNDVTHAI
ncbi:MAG: class I SAM-dependent methyltransferase [Promethearchaeota archaeon]